MRQTLVPFAQKNPDLQITTELKRAKHPLLRGEYLNGNKKAIGIKNMTVEEIDSYVFDLRNQIGRKVLQRKTPVEVAAAAPLNVEGKHTNSIQGEWSEQVSLIGLDFEIEHVHTASKEAV